MKEHVQKPGVRKWAGEDLLELQGETLTALQALVEPYAPCIIQGCGVGQTDGIYQVQPGIVALKGSNEDGSACTKIVRFAGYTGEVLPIYLTIKVTPYMRVYADEENKPIAYEYTAEAFTNEPADIPYLKIDASGGSRLVDTIGITQKLDREGGNASNVKVVSFKEDTAAGRINIAAGMTMKELFGRIYRWLRDLQPIAFKEKVEKDDFKDELKTEFNNKVDKDGNKVLSTNDFTDAMRDKLKDIEAGAEVNVQADWSVTETKSDAFIKNKPTASNIGGKLPIANGGTGETTAAAAAGALLNGLGTGNAIPADNANIIISGNGTTTYYRKPLFLLWNWIKTHIDSSLSDTSTNPVQNKAVTAGINEAKTAAGNAKAAADEKLPLTGGTIVEKNAPIGDYNYSNRACLRIISQQDQPCDLVLGSNGTMKYSITARNSSDTEKKYGLFDWSTDKYVYQIDKSNNFNFLYPLMDNGARVYSPNNKPPLATASEDGLMSSGDFSKLSGMLGVAGTGYWDGDRLINKFGNCSVIHQNTGIYLLGDIPVFSIAHVMPISSDTTVRVRKNSTSSLFYITFEDASTNTKRDSKFYFIVFRMV